jgi:hypothetical protein
LLISRYKIQDIKCIYIFSDDDIHPNCFKNNILVRGKCNGSVCYHAEQINKDKIENCTELRTYNFFSNSNLSFIFTFLGVSTFFCGKNCLLLMLFNF